MNGEQPDRAESAVTKPAEMGYYGVPVIHGAHWKWLVIGYFFLGGISGSSAAIAAFANAMAGSRNANLSRTATYVAFVSLVPCPVLLILDLGRPARFLNMLRTFRTSSPMSLGSWGLTLYGALLTLLTLAQVRDDLIRATAGPALNRGSRDRQLLAGSCGVAGLFVAGYTGVLLSATAVPLWSKRPALLGPLFLSSAMASGAAAVSLANALLQAPETDAEESLLRFEAVASMAEGSLLATWIMALGPIAKPISTGLLGYVAREGVLGAGIALPLALSAFASRLPRRRRAASVAAAALTLAGGFALRFAVVEGGRLSADDPAATFDLTR